MTPTLTASAQGGKPVMLDLFAGRLGWSMPFLEAGWRVVALDLVLPSVPIPEGVDYVLCDIMTLRADDLRRYGACFATCSSPCEQFSVHGMKHFHPNPPYPEMGIKLFNHARALLEELGIMYVMENVRSAKDFVGRETNHCGPFYLWGPGVPAMFPPDAYRVTKGIDWGSSKDVNAMQTQEEKRQYRDKPHFYNRSFSTSQKRKNDVAKAAQIPEPLARAVCELAARYIP